MERLERIKIREKENIENICREGERQTYIERKKELVRERARKRESKRERKLVIEIEREREREWSNKDTLSGIKDLKRVTKYLKGI